MVPTDLVTFHWVAPSPFTGWLQRLGAWLDAHYSPSFTLIYIHTTVPLEHTLHLTQSPSALCSSRLCAIRWVGAGCALRLIDSKMVIEALATAVLNKLQDVTYLGFKKAVRGLNAKEWPQIEKDYLKAKSLINKSDASKEDKKDAKAQKKAEFQRKHWCANTALLGQAVKPTGSCDLCVWPSHAQALGGQVQVAPKRV